MCAAFTSFSFVPHLSLCEQHLLSTREQTLKRQETQIAHAIETKQYLDEVVGTSLPQPGFYMYIDS